MNCPFCYKDEIIKLENHLDGDMNYNLNHCISCDGQFWVPFQNPGHLWYENDPRYSSRNADPILKPNKNHLTIVNFLGRKGSLLDVGCGVGNFLVWARSVGWKVSGLDFDREAVKVAKSLFGLDDVTVSDPTSYFRNNPDRKFDVITFFDFIEHIDNPNVFLSEIKKAMNPEGFISFSTPYRHGFKWLKPHDLPPRHLSRWSVKAVKNILEKNGFEPVLIFKRSEGLSYIVMKLRFRFGKYLSFGLVNKLSNLLNKNTEKGASKNKKNSNIISQAVGLARIKDWIIFGVPATLIYLAMLPFDGRYVTLFVIAKPKNDKSITNR